MTELFDQIQFAALVLALYLMGVMVIATFRYDNSLIDIAYGAGFVLISWLVATLWSTWSDRQWIVLGCVTLWGVRLTLRILRKNWGKPEDFRYRAWREAWTQRGMLYFFFRSFGQIYFLQGVVILVVSLPILITFATSQSPLGWYNWLGLALWITGFLFEVIGDWQLDRFIRKSENVGKIMTSGLWKYTRHPNYFGEATMWWGIFLVVFGLPLTHLAIASPMLITFLLTRVSGIPMLEARWTGRPDWEAYKAKTNAFIPWLPKKETV